MYHWIIIQYIQQNQYKLKAYVFPGQGAQFVGMGKPLYDLSDNTRTLFEEANEILGFRITDLMFSGTDDDLKQTKVTQPAIFLHSVILAKALGNAFKPEMVAGHSLGEFSALVAAGALSFEDGLRLVAARANAMQKACEIQPSTMAAILGLDDFTVEDICLRISDVVVPANYNCPGQIVISGTIAFSSVAETSFSIARIDTCSATFFNCLTLPGHGYFKISSLASSVNFTGCILLRSAKSIPNLRNSR